MPERSPRLLVSLTWLLPLLVLVQAVLAGQAWFQGSPVWALHAGVGHTVLLLSVVAAVWSWLARTRRLAAVLATVALIAVVGQTGLGYAGHRSGHAIASSLHIPLGATILALTAVVAVLVSLPVEGARQEA